MKIKCVAFDLDGTLFDSVGWFRDIYIELVHSYGGPKEYNTQKIFEEFAKNHYDGKDLIYVAYTKYLIKIFNLKGCSAKDMNNQIAKTCRIQYEISLPRAGVTELIAKLKQEGKKLAIVTSAEIDDIKSLAKNPNFDLSQFDVVITSDDVTKKKPNKEPYLEAAKRLGVSPQEMAVFEDSLNGAESAKSAGVGLLIIFNDKHSNHERENLKKLTPHSINSFYEFDTKLLGE